MAGTTESYFKDEAGFEAGVLRQGDVVSDVLVCGAVSLKNVGNVHGQGNEKPPTGWTVNQPPKMQQAMVLSHSCEIAPENKVKLTSVILAPLRDVQNATNKDKVAELIESNLIDPEDPHATFLKYFYIPPHPSLQYPGGAVCDFAKLFSVHKSAYDSLVEGKAIQLSDAAADAMALKLAMYFHRRQEAA